MDASVGSRTVTEGASVMQSSLGSLNVSNVIPITMRWGEWGSNPRPADYEKYGFMHHTR